MAYQEEKVSKAKAIISNSSLPALLKINESISNVFKKGTVENDRHLLEMDNYAKNSQKYFESEHKALSDLGSAIEFEKNARLEYNANGDAKTEAFFKTALGSSPAAKAVGRFAIENFYSSGKEDSVFMKGNTPDSRAATLQAAGLGLSEYNADLLAGAKNQNDFDFYMQTLQTDKEFAMSSKYLTKTQRTSAEITGAMADPTYLAYAPVAAFKGLVGGARIASIVGANSALQFGLSKARDYGAPERTGYDTMLDVAFGGVVDSALALRQLKKIDEFNSGNMIDATAVAHSNARDMARVAEEVPPTKYDFSQNYTWSVSSEVKPVYSTVEEMRASRPTTVQPVRRTAEESAALKAEADAEVASFKAVKAEEIASAISKSGLSEVEFMKVYDNLGADVKELRSIIRDATSSGEKGIYNTIEEIMPIIEHIGKVSPSAKASLLADVEKVLGMSYKPRVLTASAKGKKIAMKSGKDSFKTTVNKFNKILSSNVKKEKARLDKLAGKAKPMKATTDNMTGLSKKEATSLTSIQSKLDALTQKITALGKAGAEESKITKLLDEHAKLTDMESALLIKTEKFKSLRESATISSLAKQKELYQSMASVMHEVLHDMKAIFNDMFKDGLPTRAEKEIFIKEASDNLTDILGQNIKLAIKDGEFVVENELKIEFKDGYAMFKGKKLMLAATFMAVMGASSAMADDGSSTVLSNAPLYLIMLGLGIFGFRAISNNGGVIASLKSGIGKVASIEKMALFQSSNKAKALNDAKNAIVDKANFEAINAIQIVMNNGTAFSKAFAQRIGFDAVNPQKILNAMVNRMILLRDDMRAFREAEEINYKAWLLEGNIKETRIDRLLNAGAETLNRERFLDEVTDFREFGRGESKAVKAQAAMLAERMDGTFARGVAYNLKGFAVTAEKLAGKINNYIPRLPKYDDVMSIVASGGKSNLIEEFTKAISKSRGVSMMAETADEIAELEKIRSLAESMIDGYTTVGVRGGDTTRVNDIIKAMESLGYDVKGLDANEIATTVRTNNDAISRGKFRIEMDFSDFKPFKLANGQEVSYSSVFERNSGTLLQTYSSQVNGMISMKKATKGLEGIEDGVDTEFAISQLIRNEPNPRVRAVLSTFTDSVLGRPLYDVSSDASKVVSVLRDLAYSRLALTQFAMASEYSTAISSMLRNNQALGQGLGNLRNIIKNIMGEEGTNTAISNTITRLTGLGSSVLRRETSFKNLEGMYNVVDDVGKSGAEKAASFVKYVSLVASRILHADDAMKRISGIANTDRLDRFLNGKYDMSANRLERLGIDDDFIATFKGAFERDSKGNLVAEFDAKWTDDMRDSYANVMHRMIMTDSPEAIVSSLPHMTSTDNAGRLVGFMTSFTAQSYTTKALQGLRRPDMRSAVETSIYFLGTYAGMYGRDITTGKHKDTEEYYDELMFKSVTMMPLTAPYGMLSMMTDPMTTSIAVDTYTQGSKLMEHLGE